MLLKGSVVRVKTLANTTWVLVANQALCARVSARALVEWLCTGDLRDPIHNLYGLMLERKGDQVGGLREYQACLKIDEAQLKTEPHDVNILTSLQIASGHIGMQETRLYVRGAETKALDAAVAGLEKVWAADPSQTFYANLLVVGYAYQGEAFLLRGDMKSSLARYSKSLATAERLSREDTVDLESRLSIVKLHQAIAIVQARDSRITEAKKELMLALERAAELSRLRPEDGETSYVMAQVRDNLNVLNACEKSQSCAAVRQLPLPVLIN